jgi:hypothetical protein
MSSDTHIWHVWKNRRNEEVHRQCSMSAPEEIKENRLVCCLGQEVADPEEEPDNA